MMEKIEWYQEILKLDPDSRAFFPLAQLLRESQQPEKAVEVLRAGLRHSSVFMEARLLLIQILFEQSRSEECAGELSAVTDLLEAYPAFWEVWADSVAGKNRDLALAIRLMVSTVRHPERSLSQILECGLEILQDVRRTFAAPPSVSPQEPEQVAAENPAPQAPVPATPPVPAESVLPAEPLVLAEPSVPVASPVYAVPFVPVSQESPASKPSVPSASVSGLLSEPASAPVADIPVWWEPEDVASPEPPVLPEEKPLAPEPAEEPDEVPATLTGPTEPTEWSEPEAIPEAYRLPRFSEEDDELSDEDLSDYAADDLSEEPTVRTRSMADILAAQGDVVGALEIYQELEAAAPTPEEARELHDSVVALASRVAGNADSGEQAENGLPPYGDTGSQSNLMSLLESLADRLEARARV